MIIMKRGPETNVEDVVFRNLGIKSTNDINAWFKKSYAGGYRIDGLEEAVSLILDYAWDNIAVVGDYDVDGVTATAQMKLVLETLRLPVSYRIPRRFSEGFGLNPNIVDEIPDGKTLLITVDNGIGAIEAVRHAKERGFTVIVTDHHEPAVDHDGNILLPDADLIIDPNAIEGQADFPGYCGSGLAYRLLCALLDRKSGESAQEAETRLYRGLKAVIQPLAAMGTVADVMDLVEENYVIVRNGLSKMEKRIAPQGLLALNDKLWIIQHPTATDIAFKSGPAVNANGRLYDDGAAKSVELLSCRDYDSALKAVNETIENNRKRKEMVKEAADAAEAMIREKKMEDDLPLVISLPGTNEGIIGILAGKLQERYRTVSIVFTDSEEEGVLKGSGRSTTEIDLKGLLDTCQDKLVRYGGHKGAAGLSVRKEDLEELREELQKTARKKRFKKENREYLFYDLSIEASMVPDALKELERFEPFGKGNEEPVFEIRGFTIKARKEFGETGIQLYSPDAAAVSFDRRKELLACSRPLTIYGTLSYNYFGGKKNPQIQIIDFEEE